MKNVFGFLKTTGVAMAIVLCSFVSIELHGMKQPDSHPVTFVYLVGANQVVVDAEVTHSGDWVTGEDLYVAAQSYAPENFSVMGISLPNKQIEDTSTRVFYPNYGDQEFEFTVNGQLMN